MVTVYVLEFQNDHSTRAAFLKGFSRIIETEVYVKRIISRTIIFIIWNPSIYNILYYAGSLGQWAKRIVDQASDALLIFVGKL